MATYQELKSQGYSEEFIKQFLETEEEERQAAWEDTRCAPESNDGEVNPLCTGCWFCA